MNTLSLSGNWIDFLIVIFLFTYLISSFNKGFLISLIDLAGFLISFLLALKFYSICAYLLVNNFSLPIGIANALGFILLGFTIETVFFVVIRIFYPLIPRNITGSIINKIFGPLPAIINGLIIISFFLSVIVATPIQPQIKKTVLTSKIGGPMVESTQVIEQEVAKIFGEAVIDTLSFITVPPTSSERVDLQFTTTDVSIDQVSENEMLSLVNNERNKQGLGDLTIDQSLVDVARLHGKDMFKKGYFSHISPEGKSPFDRLNKYGISFKAAGENLAYAPTVGLAHQGLMQSKGHRENILSEDFNRVGIGVIDAGIYGKMFVQMFKD